MELYIKGSGSRSILMIHGFLEDHSMWNDLQFDGYTQLLLNLPGHGGSDLFPYQDINELSEKITIELGQLGRVPDIIIGHSMGGYVAIELFKAIAGSSALILLNSNFWADSDLKKEDRKRVAEIVYGQKRLFLETAIPNLFADKEKFNLTINELISSALQMTPESIAMASLAMMERKDNTHYLKSEHRPILVIQGQDDTIVPHDLMMQNTSDWLPIIVLPGGHMSHVEAKELLKSTLIRFFDGLDLH